MMNIQWSKKQLRIKIVMNSLITILFFTAIVVLALVVFESPVSHASGFVAAFCRLEDLQLLGPVSL